MYLQLNLGAATLPAGSQFIECDDVVGLFCDSVAADPLGGERRNGPGELLDDLRNSDGEHALATAEQVDDLVVAAALVHGGAVGNEGDLGDLVDAAVTQLSLIHI